MRQRRAFGSPSAYSGHSTCQMARHERTFGSPVGEAKVSRMVPLRACVKGSSAANIEFAGTAA